VHRIIRIVIPALIAGVTFVACASTGGASGSPAPTAAAAESKVTIKGFKFDPVTLTVAKGTKVTFDNQDTAAHTVTSGANRTKDNTFDNDVAAGAQTTITFDKSGTFAYFCRFHATMTATVVVN
jgi:manganese oxidase